MMRSSWLFSLLLLPLVCALLLMLSWPSSQKAAASDSEGNNASGPDSISISGDGRYVAFSSQASNLVPGDTNGKIDVFVRDRQTGATTRVSVDSNGNQANDVGWHPAMSADGRYVAFASAATNLSPEPEAGYLQVYVHDLVTGSTELVSRNGDGVPGNQASATTSEAPSISGDGNYIAFWSAATNLGGTVTNNNGRIYVRDRSAGTTTLLTVGYDGSEANGGSQSPAISADGCYIAYTSSAYNLVPGDTNGVSDVFVYDCHDGTTTRVSVDDDGAQGDGASRSPSISGDGTYVAFSSFASNLTSDSRGYEHIIVHDRQAGQNQRVDYAWDGGETDGGAMLPVISAYGDIVAFISGATNIVPNDTNGVSDVFVTFLAAPIEMMGVASEDSSGVEGNGSSGSMFAPAMNSDGQQIAFYSQASNLVSYDTNNYCDYDYDDVYDDNCSDAFVHGIAPLQTERVSLPDISIMPTPTPITLPDLIVQDMYYGGCIPFQSGANFYIEVKNIGTAAAGPSTTLVDSYYQLSTCDLQPGWSTELMLPLALVNGEVTAAADWGNVITESDETNNSLTKNIIRPACGTPTMTPIPTATPTATATYDPPSVGGLAEAPEDAGGANGGGPPTGALAMLAGVALVVVTAGGWYARRVFARK